MKCNTEQFVKKINVPIVCRFDGKELFFENGTDFAAYPLERNYLVDLITIENASVVISLREHPVSNIHSIGNKMGSVNDWVKEHMEHFGKEPNLFDGA